MTYTYTQLRNAINADAGNLGLAAFVTVRDDVSVASLLNSRTTGSTSLQPVVMAESTLAGLLTDPTNGSLVKLLNWVNFGLVKADIEANNRVGVGLWATKLQLLGIIVAAETSAIAAYAASTSPVACSYAESQWGFGTVIPVVDVSLALNGRA